MKYIIEVDVESLSDTDVAALPGVLSYILQNSIRSVPGVVQVSVSSLATEPDPV